MNNIAFIYQPHFMTNKFRVALNDQRGENYNYIIVTCSPEYNGVYRYPVAYIHERRYEIWNNKNKVCVCVPIEDCEKRGELTDIKKLDIMTKVKKQQEQWYKNEVENVTHKYIDKPVWMLK